MSAILLVEDDPDDLELTLLAFERAGIGDRVRVARNGVEALEILHGEGAILPRVVLLDLKLPLLPGMEVLRRIRADPRTRVLPVVDLTSSSEERDLVEAYGHGANSYVRKPVGFEAFLEASRQLGVYWTSLNLPPAWEGP